MVTLLIKAEKVIAEDMHVWPKKRLRRCYVLADVIIFVCEVPCIFWHYINVDEVSWIAQKIITKCDGIITNCDSLVYYKVQWTVITNCDSFFITNCDTVYYKLWQVLQSAMDLLQIATGITKCDDYYKLRQYTHSQLIHCAQLQETRRGIHDCQFWR